VFADPVSRRLLEYLGKLVPSEVSVLILLASLMLAVLLLPMRLAYGADAGLDAKAREIDEHVLKIDVHTDVLLPGSSELNYAPGHASRTDLSNLKTGGIGAVAFAVAVGPGPRTAAGTKAARAEADAKLTWIQTFVRDNPGRVALATSASDIERIHRAGKVAVIESFQNARSLGGDLSAIDTFYHAGVRLFGLTHAGNNEWADSSRPTGEPVVEHHGLSPLGKRAVAKLNALGVIIDVSQLTPEGVLQIIDLSKAPVIASHSDVRALVDNTRNLSDTELDAIAKSGGVPAAASCRLRREGGCGAAEIRSAAD
jgi:membrane dipeptidase